MPSENAAMRPRVKYAPAKEGVSVAKRIYDQAKQVKTLVFNVLRQLAAGKGLVFTDKGEARLNGVDKPVRLHEVRWQD